MPSEPLLFPAPLSNPGLIPSRVPGVPVLRGRVATKQPVFHRPVFCSDVRLPEPGGLTYLTEPSNLAHRRLPHHL